MKQFATARFDETVDLAVNLGVDPRKPNQSIKGVARLPHGNGKKVRVAVFATGAQYFSTTFADALTHLIAGADAEAALAAGADVVGSTDLIARIQAGELPFDRAIATPSMMSIVSKVGRILGPRGLMPNPKMGTVTDDVSRAVKQAKEGQVPFRVEKQGIVHAGVGKVSFSKEALLENIRSVMVAIVDAKPEGFKGKYIQKVHLSSTMGPGINIDLPSVDPSSARFMLSALKIGRNVGSAGEANTSSNEVKQHAT